mmetsp:Transcript_44435/g.125648  ORF Transcript_44435/g.125648 Transcript_44435/m.125648 type:complete len:238 (-) Transcript_44435:108-821(-)
MLLAPPAAAAAVDGASVSALVFLFPRSFGAAVGSAAAAVAVAAAAAAVGCSSLFLRPLLGLGVSSTASASAASAGSVEETSKARPTFLGLTGCGSGAAGGGGVGSAAASSAAAGGCACACVGSVGGMGAGGCVRQSARHCCHVCCGMVRVPLVRSSTVGLRGWGKSSCSTDSAVGRYLLPASMRRSGSFPTWSSGTLSKNCSTDLNVARAQCFDGKLDSSTSPLLIGETAFARTSPA